MRVRKRLEELKEMEKRRRNAGCEDMQFSFSKPNFMKKLNNLCQLSLNVVRKDWMYLAIYHGE